MRFCPYAQRTILCLNAKEADYRVRKTSLQGILKLTIMFLEDNYENHCEEIVNNNETDALCQTINCALMTRPDWLWEINPFGKVPVLLYKVIDIYR